MSQVHTVQINNDTQAYRLLELVAVSGELPADQIARLSGGNSYKETVITLLKENKLIRIRTFCRDKLRGYRLTRRLKSLLLSDNPERFDFYLTGKAETNLSLEFSMLNTLVFV